LVSGASLADVARCLDLDKLRSSWERFAGPDDSMDWEEYQLFMKAVGLPDEHAANMWKIMDSDKSGQVDSDEFNSVLTSMTGARAWLRYCPDCHYENTCDFCMLVADCPKCSAYRFCPEHWADHPGPNVCPPTK